MKIHIDKIHKVFPIVQNSGEWSQLVINLQAKHRTYTTKPGDITKLGMFVDYKSILLERDDLVCDINDIKPGTDFSYFTTENSNGIIAGTMDNNKTPVFFKPLDRTPVFKRQYHYITKNDYPSLLNNEYPFEYPNSDPESTLYDLKKMNPIFKNNDIAAARLYDTRKFATAGAWQYNKIEPKIDALVIESPWRIHMASDRIIRPNEMPNELLKLILEWEKDIANIYNMLIETKIESK